MRKVGAAEQDQRSVVGRQPGNRNALRVADEMQAVAGGLHADVIGQHVHFTGCCTLAGFGQLHRQRRHPCHLLDQVAVAATVQAHVHQHRHAQRRRQRTEQAAQRIRAANAGQHQQRAGTCARRRRSVQVHQAEVIGIEGRQRGFHRGAVPGGCGCVCYVLDQ